MPRFAEAMRRALRQDPDVILVGEMRDLETIEAAITAAETGHIVFGTLHTTGAQGTVNRIIDVFPTNQQEQIRTQLSTAIIGVLSQALLPKIGGGRVAAYEMLVVTPAIANLIRENKTFRINSAIQTGAKLGMQLLDDHLFQLWNEKKVTEEDVLVKAQNPDELAARIAEAKQGMFDDDETRSADGGPARTERQPADRLRAGTHSRDSPWHSGESVKSWSTSASSTTTARDDARRAAAAAGELLGQIAVSMGFSPTSSWPGAGRADGHHVRHARRPGDPARSAGARHRADGPALPDRAASASKDNTLTIAMCDPQKLSILDELRSFLGYDIRVVRGHRAPRSTRPSERYYAVGRRERRDADRRHGARRRAGRGGRGASERTAPLDLTSVEALADSAPVRKLLNMVLLLAIKDHASDLHFEPFENEFKIRIRADGVLYEMVPPPRHLAFAITTRIKVMANLDIAERRLPQDGRIG